MTNDVFNRLKEDAYKVCVLGDYDQRIFDDLWSIILDFEEERRKHKEHTRQLIANRRKSNPNYARSVDANGKRIESEKGKNGKDD